jgi:hypothetical protein
MWYYKGYAFTPEQIEDYEGFVYQITNLSNHMKYIGKKNFHKSKTFQKNKKKKKTRVESDWQNYYGSCKELQEDFEKLGPTQFYRQIIHLCKSKSEMNYLELREQMMHDVVLSSSYYNSFVGTRVHRKHLDKNRERILSLITN